MSDDKGVTVGDDVLADVLDVLVVKVRQGDLLVRYKEVTHLNNSEMALVLEKHGFRPLKADTFKMGDEPVVGVSFRTPGLGFAPVGDFVDDFWYLPEADLKRTCAVLARAGLTPVE